MRLQAAMEGIKLKGDPDCAIPEMLAVQKLYLHQAAIDSLEVSEGDITQGVEQQINYMINAAGGREKLEEYRNQSLTQMRAQMRDEYRDRQLAERMKEKIVSNVSVTPADVREYFKHMPADSVPLVPTEVEVQIITQQPKVEPEELNRVKDRLRSFTERVASGDFSEKLEVDSTDEIGILTTTFNDMASVLHSTLEAVEDERNKLDTLFLHMTDGVVAYDRDGALIHCNPAASELLERSADECVYADLFEPLCPFEKVMAMQRSDFVASELTVGERTVELYFAPFSDEERGGVLVVLHDVTQQRKAEERRREFVANVSHELRTPLTNIRSYAETIRDAGDELPRELENSFLDIVINESDRMTHIVQDLLTLSRLDSGRSEMNMARFDFGAAIDSVLRSIELEARRHGHELTHDYHDLPMIMGDRGRIEQVMLNVLGNAVKYTPDGGHIRVTAGTVGERVWMEVADDGIGIPKADRSRIFERFYRVDKARSRESGGTGLGLSIATEIVQRHNGTLSLVDREGPGTTVRLELPIRQSEVGGAQEGGNG